ncbi:ArsR/SmtB family transcription factor [Cohaesibacter celericrescens]|uniref:Transcriptional regulator n=1 Tax=Cohaesibacter celericrescens TaxID=2067669 RepID=A0A2N5XKX8_9HYPH|nr:helix-turn-helix domain-containing protein [Cohaesibacter celericrescens]PLW75087.1 transcriptional regulator [Cohaesibacter celericrescens]
MKEGPDIALLGAMIGDPARANILTALMSGKALTATELSTEAGITLQTASSHFKKLEEAGLISQRKQGRHRYFTLADEDVGQLLEAMMGLAAKRGLMRTRTGPKDPALRKARICYDHLAGDYSIVMFDFLVKNRLILKDGDDLLLTSAGEIFAKQFGIDVDALRAVRRPMCKSCLDWSNRRSHLAGALGQALLIRFNDLGWTKRIDGTRIIQFSAKGDQAFRQTFGD